jgi:hypothetical protein
MSNKLQKTHQTLELQSQKTKIKGPQIFLPKKFPYVGAPNFHSSNALVFEEANFHLQATLIVESVPRVLCGRLSACGCFDPELS